MFIIHRKIKTHIQILLVALLRLLDIVSTFSPCYVICLCICCYLYFMHLCHSGSLLCFVLFYHPSAISPIFVFVSILLSFLSFFVCLFCFVLVFLFCFMYIFFYFLFVGVFAYFFLFPVEYRIKILEPPFCLPTNHFSCFIFTQDGRRSLVRVPSHGTCRSNTSFSYQR